MLHGYYAGLVRLAIWLSAANPALAMAEVRCEKEAAERLVGDLCDLPVLVPVV